MSKCDSNAPSKARDLCVDVGSQITDFVADRSEDGRRLADLDALQAVHKRLESDRVLAALLAECRDEADCDGNEICVTYENADIYGTRCVPIEDLQTTCSRGASTVVTESSILACIDSLLTMGFEVWEHPGDSSLVCTIKFPWIARHTKYEARIPSFLVVHLAKPNAPWRLFITESEYRAPYYSWGRGRV